MTPAARPRLRSISGRKSSERVMVEPRHVKKTDKLYLASVAKPRGGGSGPTSMYIAFVFGQLTLRPSFGTSW